MTCHCPCTFTPLSHRKAHTSTTATGPCVQGREAFDSVQELFGLSAEAIVSLPLLGGDGASSAQCAVGGYLVLPPLGHPNRSRQLVYLNGRCVRAAPLCDAIAGLFEQLYKPNARRLLAAGPSQARAPDGKLHSVHRAGNRHAMYVLDLQCSPACYDLLYEPRTMVAEFHAWAPVVGAVMRAVVRAWTPVLPDGLLRQLEMHGGAAGAGRQRAGAGTSRAAAGSLGDVLTAGEEEGVSQALLGKGGGGDGATKMPSSGGGSRGARTASPHEGRAGRAGCASAALGADDTRPPPAKRSKTSGGRSAALSGPSQGLTSRLVRIRRGVADSSEPRRQPEPDPSRQAAGTGSTHDARALSNQSCPPFACAPQQQLPLGDWRQMKSAAAAQQWRASGQAQAWEEGPKRTARCRLTGAGQQQAASWPEAGRRAGGVGGEQQQQLRQLARGEQQQLEVQQPQVELEAQQQQQQQQQDAAVPSRGMASLLASWRGGAYAGAAGAQVLDTQAIAASLCADLAPGDVSREQMQRARALEQIDRKFVPVVCGSTLALVDQHAAGGWVGGWVGWGGGWGGGACMQPARKGGGGAVRPAPASFSSLPAQFQLQLAALAVQMSVSSWRACGPAS
jgi:hypothetical protein